MRTKNFFIVKILFAVFLAGIFENLSAQTIGNDTTITAFNAEFINWANTHTDTFIFPSPMKSYQQITMHYSIQCPAGGCDPWDRFANIVVTTKDTTAGQQYIEIARVITPYAKECSWDLDVSDYSFLLRDTVILHSYIETWIGGTKGYLLTVTFDFKGGIPAEEPYAIKNLWQGRPEYGNPVNDIENFLSQKTITIDPNAEIVNLRVITTGHGQGNTDNAAEFSNKYHTLKVNGNAYTKFIWRADCEFNSCSPQSGTWQYDRAGWCPGDEVVPWDIDVTSKVTPGSPATFDYDVQPYTNNCRPGVSPCPCADCNYNGNGHTMPIYIIESQVIYYKIPPAGIADESNGKENIHIYPNPADGKFKIDFCSSSAKKFKAEIYNTLGEKIYQTDNYQSGARECEVDLSHHSLGIYFVKIQTEENVFVRKILLIEK